MERPKISSSTIEKAAKMTASQTCNIEPNEVSDLAKDIARAYRHHMDGYQIAKRMEDFGWDVDAMFVEDMDNMGANVSTCHDEEQRLWTEQYNPQPPYPIGAKTTKGKITGIYEHGAAKYTIKEPGQDDEKTGYRRLIVNFEDVVLAP